MKELKLINSSSTILDMLTTLNNWSASTDENPEYWFVFVKWIVNVGFFIEKVTRALPKLASFLSGHGYHDYIVPYSFWFYEQTLSL